MKLLPDLIQGPRITGYGADWVGVNDQRFTSSLLIDARSGSHLWPCPDFDGLERAHFDRLLDYEPELVLFGSGAQLRFARPQWLQSLYARRIGVETMDTPGACRTFNFLAAEGRKVVAALLL